MTRIPTIAEADEIATEARAEYEEQAFLASGGWSPPCGGILFDPYVYDAQERDKEYYELDALRYYYES